MISLDNRHLELGRGSIAGVSTENKMSLRSSETEWIVHYLGYVQSSTAERSNDSVAPLFAVSDERGRIEETYF